MPINEKIGYVAAAYASFAIVGESSFPEASADAEFEARWPRVNGVEKEKFRF